MKNHGYQLQGCDQGLDLPAHCFITPPMTQQNPKEFADHLIKLHGLDGAIEVAMEGTATAADNYSLSVWREVKLILKERREQGGS